MSAAVFFNRTKSRESTIALDEQGRRAQELFLALFEGTSAAVLELDSAMVITRANRHAYELFAMSAEIVGTPLLQSTTSLDILELALVAQASGDALEKEISGLGPQRRTAVVRIIPKSEGAVLIAQDVTDLRRLETVRQDFVANVSHELRTPLASIRAITEALQEGALEEKPVAERFLGMIVHETERLARIADDLLVLTRAETGQLEKGRFDLADLAREAFGKFQTRAEKAEIQLEAHLPENLPISGSEDQIEQVVVNLLDNALKYTPKGGRVRLAASRHGGKVSLCVEDTGIGIKAQDLPRVFERFYRVDKARSRESGGTGLGLSIVKHIIDAHGGAVRVESTINKGSTFTIDFPAEEQ